MHDTDAAPARPARTDAMLGALLARWCARPAAVDMPDGHRRQLQQARRTVQHTLEGYRRWMSAPDQALYTRLVEAEDADALSALFFDGFDLMVRTRGPALAVLRMHELYRLLQPHVTRRAGSCRVT